jgi:hypothetical protein
VLALSPLLELLQVGLQLDSLRALTRHPTDPTAMLTPGYFASIGLTFVLYLLNVLWAFLDHRALRARGVPAPFHWAWAFLSGLIYLIGRPLICSRRGARGSAPAVIGFVAAEVVSTIVALALIASQLGPLMASIGSVGV